MKIYKLVLLVITTFFVSSCEDVITVDLDTAAPKLVIDASIQWQKGTSGNVQKIKLSTTTGFYSTTIPTVSGATVTVSNSSNVLFNFIEQEPNSGIYICSSFVPVLEETYVLTVVLNGETYKATEILKSVVPIASIQQKDDGGILGDAIELKAFFNDPPIVNNYYLFRYKPSTSAIPTFEVSDDRFTQGNESFGLFINEDIQAGSVVEITFSGISRRYFEYMNKLITVAGGSSGSPFSTPPATVRGNIVNQTNFKNFALGYFNLSETDYRNYVVQ